MPGLYGMYRVSGGNSFFGYHILLVSVLYETDGASKV